MEVLANPYTWSNSSVYFPPLNYLAVVIKYTIYYDDPLKMLSIMCKTNPLEGEMLC